MKILLDKVMMNKNLTIRQVSSITGVPKSTLCDILSEKTSPRMDTMERIAKGLKITISELYDSSHK